MRLGKGSGNETGNEAREGSGNEAREEPGNEASIIGYFESVQ